MRNTEMILIKRLNQFEAQIYHTNLNEKTELWCSLFS